MKAVEWNPREVKRFVNNIILSKAVFDKLVNNLIVIQALKLRPEFLESGTQSQTQAYYDKAFRDWQISSAVIGSQIRAYYPKEQFGQDWDNYSKLVTDIYTLSGDYNITLRSEQIQKIKSHFPMDSNFTDWQVLLNKKEPTLQWQKTGAH